MHAFAVLSSLSLVAASVLPADHPVTRQFKRMEPSRSPCPALNVLANEGILPQSGLNITEPMFIDALTKTYNLDPAFAKELASGAITSLGNGGNSIDLSALNKHGVIEHDASLTRLDIIQGDNYHVQQPLVEALIADTGNTGYITVSSLAKTRSRRETDSQKAGSPSLGAKGQTLALGESGLILQALGHLEGKGTKPTSGWAAPVEAFRVWVGEERLPKGYTPPPRSISFGTTSVVAAEVTAAKGLGAVANAVGAITGASASRAASLISGASDSLGDLLKADFHQKIIANDLRLH